jgi:hypothetical protein
MTRITKEWLKSRVYTLNILLERPGVIYDAGASASDQNIGHLMLDKDSTGYRLVEIVSSNGAEANQSPRLSPKDMNLYLDGIINGISLHNAHIGVVLLKNKAEKAGLTPSAALYSPDNAALLHSTKSGV